MEVKISATNATVSRIRMTDKVIFSVIHHRHNALESIHKLFLTFLYLADRSKGTASN